MNINVIKKTKCEKIIIRYKRHNKLIFLIKINQNKCIIIISTIIVMKYNDSGMVEILITIFYINHMHYLLSNNIFKII